MAKDIKEILKDHSIEVADEVFSAFEKDFRKDYKSVKEVELEKGKASAAQEKFDKLQADHADLQEKVAALEGDTKAIDDLKAENEKLIQAAKERDEAEEAKKEAEAFEQVFSSAVGDKKFTNDFVRKQVLASVREAHEADKAKGIKDILEEVTKDQDGVWVNPNDPNSPIELPKPSDKRPPVNDDEARRVMGLPVKEK